MMKRGREENCHETSPSPKRLLHGGVIDIPLDLTVEILKKLPAKSLVRFQCVSKLWSSIISSRRDFIESIVTRSLTQPPRDAHFIFDVAPGPYVECFLVLSSTCPPNTDMEAEISMPGILGQYVRGLICCFSGLMLKVVIYNPTTRQSFHLPEVMHYGTCFFGYDPLENQYKVLFLSSDYKKQACQVFTLGDPKTKQWRKLQGVGSHHVPPEGAVCINGAIYYRGETTTSYNSRLSSSRYKLMSFDVRSEKIYHVEAPKTYTDDISTLVNYQGKLGFVYCKKDMEIWVMKDAEKETQGWSRIFFYEMHGFSNWRILGATRGGEIVFGELRCRLYHEKLLRVLYYDPKLNSMRYVDLEGTLPKDRRRYDFTSIWTVPDYVENTMCLY